MRKLIISTIIIVILVFVAFQTYEIISPKCGWKITNCCPETAGAYWECVNLKTYTPKYNCSQVMVLCPQILSPKPSLTCVFENGNCVVK